MKILIGILVLFSAALSLYKYRTTTIAEWHMINVNFGRHQGDAHLIKVGGKYVMIDAGTSREGKTHVAPYLHSKNVMEIEHFFISHPHKDHYGGLAAILGSGIKVKNVYYKTPSPQVSDCCYIPSNFRKHLKFAKDRGAKFIEPKTGFKLDLPNNSFVELVHAQEGNLPNAKLDVNDLSLIMKLSINGSTVLFTGDLNRTLGTHLSENQSMKADFLKVPHHASTGIAPNSFFDTVDPKYVLAPAQTRRWCGDRGAQAREWTIEKELPTWVNGTNGTVVVQWDRSSVKITPETSDGRCKYKEFGEIIESY